MMSGHPPGEPIDGAARPRVYLDATIIRAYEDPERAGPLHGLIRQAARDEVVLVVSDLTVEELRDATAAVHEVMDASVLPRAERVSLTAEALDLADQYVERGVFARSRRCEARHVAAATVAGANVIGSWNHRIANWGRIRGYNEVNRIVGHGPIDVRDPRSLEYGPSDPEPEIKLPVIEPGEKGFKVMPWLRALRARSHEETEACERGAAHREPGSSRA